ncbi:MAG: hypothetical protein AAF543_23180 [Pseudomonadota bacterium]
MLDRTDSIHWPDVVRPLAKAERALGRLAFALDVTTLHQTWLWRELTRTTAAITQNGGHIVGQDQLRLALIGAPVDPNDNTSGLAAAKRLFLTATPLFRLGRQADSDEPLWPAFWAPEVSDALGDDEADDRRTTTKADAREDTDGAGELAWPLRGECAQLLQAAREIAGFADDGRRPALINLLVDLRRHAAARRVRPSLMRLTLPLALARAGVVPRAAPGLLGGRRLPLGMSRAAADPAPLTRWLARGLGELAEEAHQSRGRLTELERQNQAWRQALVKEGLRRHAMAPKVLDLLTATPVLSIGLVANHLACSTVAAGRILERLMDLGIVLAATSRSRHKVFIAGDLAHRRQAEPGEGEPIALSASTPVVDIDRVGATLDGLFAELERLNERAEDRVRQER